MKVKIPECAFIDFETFAIEARPDYPPEPVGVAIKMPGRKSRYYAWGHVTGQNNCTPEEGYRALKEVWNSKLPMCFHNAKFDVAVAVEKMGFKMPPWERIHDTLYLLFLHDPYAANMRLKDSANRLLGLKPDEQDAMRDWLVDHRADLKADFGINVTEKNFGAYIAYAPGRVVKPYAEGDTDRTALLFAKLYRDIAERGMLKAYDTERELMPILLANEQEGMHVDLDRLAADVATYSKVREKCDEWIGKRLGVPGINVGSDQQMAEALDNAGIVTDWEYTKTGKMSMAKGTLTIDKFTDEKFYRALTYRNKLDYSLNTFMGPWLAVAERTGGTIHTAWNQVARQGAGAVTGRMSSSPNFQNLTKNVEEDPDNPASYRHPKFLRFAPELPSIRGYVVADRRGHLLGDRDFSQQELRILAHFEDGPLKDAYLQNPKLDVHTLVQGLLADAGAVLKRGQVKGFNFGILYGMGATGLSLRLGTSINEARGLIKKWNLVMPGVAQLVVDIKDTVHSGEPIVTWGGRQYGMPPPMVFDGVPRDRDYVLLNYLIQGSGADATKRAAIEFHKQKREARMLATVHDEILFNVPSKAALKREMAILNECITSLDFDVPMGSDGKWGLTWGTLEKYKD